MRLAYVYDAVYPWVTGGVEKRLWELSRRLADDHDVHWFGLQWWDGPAVVEREGVTIHGVAPGRDLYAGDRRSIPAAGAFAARLAVPLLRERFDVVDCQAFPYLSAFPAALHSRLRDASFVLTWHEVWGEYWYEYLGRAGVAGRAVERALVRLPDAHVAVSRRTRRDVHALGADSVGLLENGVDRDAVAAPAPHDREIDVLSVGRFIPEKNAELVVRALAELRSRGRDRRCLFVGEGPDRARVESLAARLGVADGVEFLDFRESYEEVLALMGAADVFAAPSRREGFGMTTLEALATGTPVVTVDHPQNAAADLVADGRTGAVTDTTPESFADGLLAAADVDGADCRASTERFDWDRIADRAAATYEEVA